MSERLERSSAPALPRARSRWALRPAQLLVVALAGLWFLLVSYLPLGGGAVLGHLSLGEWILEHRSIPAQDPFLPLAEGMRVLDREWLSQVVMAAVHGMGGARGLAVLFALSGLATVLLWGRTFLRRSGSLLWGAVGVALALGLSWGPVTTFGPHTFGIVCFALLLWLLFGCEGSGAGDGSRPVAVRGRWVWGAVPLLFVLWANLDDSFVVGLAVLLGCLAGRAVEVVRDERRLRALLSDRPLRRWLYLAELAAAATLVTPHGMRLLASVLWLPETEAARSLAESQPLPVTGLPGQAFALSVLLLLVALRFARSRLPAAGALLLLAFGWSALSRRGILTWYGPVFALTLLPLLAELGRRAGDALGQRLAGGRLRSVGRRISPLAGPSWHYSLLAFVVAWAAFALSPLGGTLLGREARPAAQTVGGAPPAALLEYLEENPPEGQVFNPAPWGDWLAREGPPGLELFAASRVEHLPPQVWSDYRRIAGGAASWDAVLDRYRVETVILDRAAYRGQVQSLRYDDAWWLAHEDPRAAVFVRAPRGPASTQAPAEPPAANRSSERSQ